MSGNVGTARLLALVVEMHRRPRQRSRVTAHEQPRQTVREDVGRRLARPPEFHQLIAVGFPVGSHFVADEGRQVRADAVTVKADAAIRAQLFSL
jgi:hypothetical protein